MEITKQCLGVGEDEKLLEGLKVSTFTTTLKLVLHRGQKVEPVQVIVDHKAAVRQAIIVALRRAGVTFKTRSDWKADVSKGTHANWSYRGVAIHHAGNSYSCSADNIKQIKKAEQKDVSSFGHISYHYAIACDGTILEALDIREKGAHVEDYNTGVVGIVLLEDLTDRGESWAEEYRDVKGFEGFKNAVRSLFDWAVDDITLNPDPAPPIQVKSAETLVKTLMEFFPIKELGGHREYQKLANGKGRACPGKGGMVVVDALRKTLQLTPPVKLHPVTVDEK